MFMGNENVLKECPFVVETQRLLWTTDLRINPIISQNGLSNANNAEYKLKQQKLSMSLKDGIAGLKLILR